MQDSKINENLVITCRSNITYFNINNINPNIIISRNSTTF